METTMRRYVIGIAVLLSALLGRGTASAMVCGQQGTTESSHTVFQHACYEYFFNNSGGALTSGSVGVLDRTGTGVNVGVTGSLTTVPVGASRNDVDVNAGDGDVTNIGTYLTTTTTADLETVIGVVDDDSCADQTYCRTQVRGPRLTRIACSTDAITTGDAVGTTTLAGRAGDAANDADGILGVALSGCRDASDDNTVAWVWINPAPNE